MHRAVVELTLTDAAEAAAMLQALRPDNGDLQARTDGRTLILEVEATTPRGALRSLDDALGCLRAAGVP